MYAVRGFLGIQYSKDWSPTLLNFANSCEKRSLSLLAASLYFYLCCFVSFCHSLAIIFTTSVTFKPLYFCEITARCSFPNSTQADCGFFKGTSFEISSQIPSLDMSVKLILTFRSQAPICGLKLYSSSDSESYESYQYNFC